MFDALRVVAEVDEHVGALAERLADEQRRAPVGQVGRVERRLVELVLDEQLHLSGERVVDLGERLEQSARASARWDFEEIPATPRPVGSDALHGRR